MNLVSISVVFNELMLTITLCMIADACLLSPARDAAVITVAAINKVDEMPSFSDGGVCVDLLAPGYEVLSAYYGSDTGTS